jgi:hypothetical protein
MILLSDSTDKCEKGYYYVVKAKGNCYYTAMQHGQRTWVANCITHNEMDAQYFVGNSYAVIAQLKQYAGSEFKIYRSRDLTNFRKGVMAVLVGIQPDREVTALNTSDCISIGVMK